MATWSHAFLSGLPYPAFRPAAMSPCPTPPAMGAEPPWSSKNIIGLPPEWEAPDPRTLAGPKFWLSRSRTNSRTVFSGIFS
jgi:hypothetical protein